MMICPFHFGTYVDVSNLLLCRPDLKSHVLDSVNMTTCRECVQEADLLGADRFHDLTGLSSTNLRFDDIENIVRNEIPLRDPVKPVKACYLVPNSLFYGLVRTYGSLIEGKGVDVFPSYDINEIAGVLGVDVSVISKGDLPADRKDSGLSRPAKNGENDNLP